jgi:hypothetical protein
MDHRWSIEFCCCATAGISLSAHAASWIDQQEEEDSTTLGIQDRSINAYYYVCMWLSGPGGPAGALWLAQGSL